MVRRGFPRAHGQSWGVAAMSAAASHGRRSPRDDSSEMGGPGGGPRPGIEPTSGALSGARRWTAIALIQWIVAGLVLLAVTGAALAVYSRVQVARTSHYLQTTAAPAHVAANTIRQGYSDQTAGALQYLLTGDPGALQRYRAGIGDSARATAQLRSLLPDDATLTADLAAVEQAAQRWRTTVEPSLTARRNGPLPSQALLSSITATTSAFDALRTGLLDLQDYAHSLETSGLADIVREQRRANLLAGAAVLLVLAAATIGIVLLRRSLVSPTRDLLRDVERIGDGDYHHQITAAGPREFTTVATAVDRMRTSILTHADDLADAQRKLAVAAEQDRLAADLHDRTVQRVYGLGLGLTSTAARHPSVEDALQPLIADTDDILRELRGVLLGLHHNDLITDLPTHVANIVHESARALGFTPTVHITGPVDGASPVTTLEFVSTLREALSNVARHAHATSTTVDVTATGQDLHLRVSDNGRGLHAPLATPQAVDADRAATEPDCDPPTVNAGHGLKNIQSRAHRLGGTAHITTTTAGTTVDWCVPLNPPDPNA